MVTVERIRVLGVPVDTVDMETALEFVDARVADGGGAPACVVAMNPEKAYAVQSDPLLRDFVEGASLLIPDGIGMVVAARLLQGVKIARVAGADLMLEICRRAEVLGHGIFIYGACEEVNRGAVAALRHRFPGIRIVGRAHGYIAPDGMDALVEEINGSGADIVFVALGSSRQEMWIRRYAPRLRVDLCLGIGGTLDTIVGRRRRAPPFVRRMGLEWLYRLLQQPNRIGRQRALPIFAWQVLAEKCRSITRRAPTVGSRP